ncbi:hypothetical protein IFM89_006754 [Coptis chinensis]|uniref:isoleucine--tRNA ligase n=1 Tax=Coptis chinensis TaxID=261450 RepID=A0A835HU54_9MAGN|nr:hypothetical protein IFM89_006754 [Coptis chinensis]
MSVLKSFKSSSNPSFLFFTPTKPKLPLKTPSSSSSSSHKVWSHRSCSFVGKTSYFCPRKISFNKSFTLFSVKHCSTSSFEECNRVSRRSRGPVMAARKASQGKKQEDGKYKHTVDLPKTKFGMRANSVVREPEIQKLWEDNQVFKRVVDRNNGGSFILHDGPPYANGDLHIGHALNKVLKDIINRYKDESEAVPLAPFGTYGKLIGIPDPGPEIASSTNQKLRVLILSKLLQNYKVRYVPGWDCHGLPIELKGKYYLALLQSMDYDARKELTPLKLRSKAAKFAKDTVKTQMKAFKRYAIWGDWDNPYLTLNPEYEAAQIEVFSQMALRGYIYRGRKPVHWSPSSRTALAEAELEYPEGHISRSVYAIFKLVSASPASNELFKEFFPNLCLAIWTTTPWTVPANAAVAVNANLQYAVVDLHSLSEDVPSSEGSGKRLVGSALKSVQRKPFLIVALDLVPALESKWHVKLTVKKTCLGSDLENCRYIHPIDKRECPVVIGGDYITTESGTGLVHTAPGHGQEDYITGLKYGLPVVSPVDDEGKFTEEAGKFSGLDVLGDGNTAVVKYLDENLSIIIEEPYKHKYPYDWRTKKPTIFRATEQWFASVEGFREAAMNAIGHVTWIPAQAENRISAMISSRSDWCISRQRTWGVPIPVFYHVDSKEPLLNEETVDHIKSIISQKGSDAWWYMSVEDLLPQRYRSKASEYQKGTDTMDVWFDSGSSWAAVLGKRDNLRYPADLYLEGTDQHRGWFQSSLLTSIATKGKAPYARVVTHGFVLDERGRKMSKSLGNVVDPITVIEGGKNSKDAPSYGADVLRLWVSSVDYTNDVGIGPQILSQISDVYRKLRGTLRYLLSNLHDWKTENAVSYGDLPIIDQYALFQLENVVNNIKDGYENYQFYKIFQIIQRFATVDLSNFYFDVAKDRLYVGGTGSYTRRSCQTVLVAHLLSIVRLIAPILPHLAEDVWQNLPFEHTSEDGSVAKFVFESRWPHSNERWLAMNAEDVDFYGKLLEVEILSSMGNGIAESIPYSGDCLIQGKKVWVGVSRADGSKCERCWNYSTKVGSFSEHPTLCSRCYNVVGVQPLPVVAAVS